MKDSEWNAVAFLPLVIRCMEFIESIEAHDKEILRRLEEFRALHHTKVVSVAKLKVSLLQIRSGMILLAAEPATGYRGA